MHVVIMGCGRVGVELAHLLSGGGHSVAVIDQSAEAFRRLRPAFDGQTVTGVGFDRDTLVEAGIERADAFAAVSSGDNSNIIAARVARETFGVHNVAARIYDPRRAEIYQRLGIPTVATVRWTADQIVRRLLPGEALTAWVDASGGVALTEVSLHDGWVGRPVADVESAVGGRVAVITRMGQALVPTARTVLQDSDLVHVTCLRTQVPDIERALGAAPED